MILAFICLSGSAEASVRPFRVVLDPGHGGSDEGTVYNDGKIRITEKMVTLALAKAAAQDLKSQGIEVFLTRESDEEVELGDRTSVANKLKANVFLSIHMNSIPEGQSSRTAYGVETYILNNTTDASSRRLAKLENTLFDHSEIGNTTEMDVAMILRDLKLDANLSESKRLACAIQGSIVKATAESSRDAMDRNRGIKQALFHVLLGAEMPSALLEAGFLSNARDRSVVLTASGQRSVAQAIAQAVIRYRDRSELGSCKIN